MHIPITFDYKNKTYIGELGQVMGAGSTATYHLMISSYYWGRLRLSAYDNKWVFDGHNGMFEELAEPFAIWIDFFQWAHKEYRGNPEEFVCCTID